jgi:PAS domain S-box-containing protein
MITSFFEFLDIRTLSLVVGGTMLVSTISMACHLFHRRTYGNFKLWALGMGCLSLGFLLFSFRGFLPDLASIVVANGLIFFSFALIYQGFRILKPDTKISGLYLAIMFILPFLIFPYFTYTAPSLNVRTSIISFTGMFHFCLCVKILGTGARDIRFRENILLGSTLVLAIIALSILGVTASVSQDMPVDFMETGTYQGLALLIIALVHIAFVMGLMQLNSQLVEKDLVEKESHLEKHQLRYHQLVEESSQGLVIAGDHPMRLLFASIPMTEICGYKPDDLVHFSADQLLRLVHPDDRGRFFNNFKKRLTGSDVSPVQQYRIFHKTKGVRWVETYTSFIEYEGQPAVHSHFLDITRRKEAEAINAAMFRVVSAVTTTRNLNELFRSIRHSLSPIIDVTNFFIAMRDTRANTLYFPYFVDMMDDDFSPVPFNEVKNSLTGLVFSRGEPILMDREALKDRHEKKGIVGTLPVIWMGVPLIIKDNVIGVVAVQSYTDPDLYTRKDLDVLFAVSSQMALAIERKQAQEALLESERRYRHLFDHAPAGICEVNFENNSFVRINEIACKVSGYARSELLKINPFDLLTRESQKRLKDRIQSLADGQRETKNIEYELITKQGKKLSVAVTLDFVDKERKRRQTLVVIHDISWRKKMEKERIEAQKLIGEHQKLALIGQVAGKMAHDFNNILGVIMGNVELMLMDHDDPGLQKTLKRILDHTEKGQHLTRNLIAFAKNQAPRQKYFSLNEKIDLGLALMKKDLEGIQVNRSYASDLPEILADPGMIEHVLINLLQNAVHALSKTKKPEITLQTFADESIICFEIRDNGCGIPEAHINDIFTPSFTLKGGRDATGAYAPGIKGTGYGMSNIQKYVHQHKGTVDVTSVQGQWTCVRICFPVIEKQLTTEEKKKIAKTVTRTDRHILVVEDEPDISGVQSRALSQPPCHHQVDVAADAVSAMDLFDQHRYDLVSLDYMLPGSKNGMDVYRHIRSSNSSVPVLFVSGNIEFIEAIKPLMEKDRYVAHLSKPCRMGAYVEQVNKMLDG